MASLNLKKIEVKLGAIHKQFSDRVVQVGFPKGANYDDGTPVAYVAAIQEFGAPAAKIPPRPFFAPAIKDNEAKWVKSIRGNIAQVTKGNMTADGVLEAVGMVAVGDIHASIENVNSPALSPVTVLLRKWKLVDKRTITGKTVGEAAAAVKAGVNVGSNNKPLQATGYLLTSVVSKVNKKGGEFTV
jgi:hypothetical protein